MPDNKCSSEAYLQYKQLFESLQEGFAVHEIICDEAHHPIDYRFLDVNPAFEQLTGLNRRDLVGRTVRELMPATEGYWIERYGEVALLGKPQRFEAFAQELGRHYSIYSYCPEPGYFATLFSDITDRVRLDEDLRAEKDRLSSLINSISDEVWFADTNGQFTLANPSAAREFHIDSSGTSVEKLATSLEVLRADGSPRPVEEAPPLRALQGETICNLQEIVRTPATGELRYRELNANPVRNADGNIIGAVAVVRDITKRKLEEVELARLYQKAEDASRIKSEFLASMSHELRTPLNVIIGFSEVLKDQLFGQLNPKQDKYVESILVSAQHLLNLINDILDLSKVEAGKMELEISEVNISEICRNSVALLQDKAAKRKVQLSFVQVPASGDVLLLADEMRIQQILFNLIDNGIKYNKPGGALSVTVSKVNQADKPPAVRIVVEDTGIGIKSDDISKLFKTFVQLSRVHTKPAEGTGLGLMLTKHLVELHGGEIRVESVFGEGSRFIVLIPVHSKQ